MHHTSVFLQVLMMAGYDFDLFVIGAGSGGVRAARMAAALGKRVAIAEEYRFGGTCVVRGCVPKKLFFYASQYSEHFVDAGGYGWSVPASAFDWKTLVARKDGEINRLEQIYRANLERAGSTTFHSRAALLDQHTVFINNERKAITADQILISTGAYPNPHPVLPGHEFCIFSNEAFDLEELPRAILIEGGGYIAVEFANIFHGLGVETTLIYRGGEILSRFDTDLHRMLHEAMEKKGIRILCRTASQRVERRPDGRLDIHITGDKVITADHMMLAIGRIPNTEKLGLDAAGVETTTSGAIVVDPYSRTNVPNIWAIGDVTNRVQLTPVAIHEAMCFIETAFKNNQTKPDHECVATAVFSQPEVGTVGLSEAEAARHFDHLEIYRAVFRPMHQILAGRDEPMMMKLVVDGDTRRVLGAHILGAGAGEMAQLLGIVLKAKLTKDDFDRTMAVHPTTAEELVTMYVPSYRVKRGKIVE
jgi:glutathione reductase (NADPH)